MSVSRTAEVFRLLDRDGEITEVEGVLLGSGSSYAVGKVRWFQVGIYGPSEGGYVVHTVGRSTVPGERDLGRVERTESAYDVVELLTVRKTSARHAVAGKRTAEPYVPHASARALAQAAENDGGLREAYLDMVA